MDTRELQTHIVYGPVASRRFGRSLGINLLPSGRRICTLSCVYCQYRDRGEEPCHFPTREQVRTEILKHVSLVRAAGPRLDWIMFSGNGEPTLHPHFTGIVDDLLRCRDRLLPDVRVGILSNSTTTCHPRIRTALERLDGRFMKLDAGSLTAFEKIGRPRTPFVWGEVIEGLSMLRDVTLQSMFIAGERGNVNDRDVNDWIGAVSCVKPAAVQVYTVDRTPQESWVKPVPAKTLRLIARLAERASGIPVEVY